MLSLEDNLATLKLAPLHQSPSPLGPIPGYPGRNGLRLVNHSEDYETQHYNHAIYIWWRMLALMSEDMRAVPVGGEKGECDARVTRLLGTRDMQARWKRESAASRARLRQTDCTMHRLCVCIPLPISAQGRDMVHAARGGGTERELTLVPIRRLVREQGLAAGVAGEAAILDAKSVELGELLPEHSAHAARGGPNGGECIRASSAQGLEIIALDYATHSSPFPPRAARALRRQHFCCRPGRHAQPDKLRHAAASNKLFRGCFLLHSPAFCKIFLESVRTHGRRRASSRPLLRASSAGGNPG
jgi:hypothetical protein